MFINQQISLDDVFLIEWVNIIIFRINVVKMFINQSIQSIHMNIVFFLDWSSRSAIFILVNH